MWSDERLWKVLNPIIRVAVSVGYVLLAIVVLLTIGQVNPW